MISKVKWAEIIKDFHEKGIPKLIERELNIPKETPLKRAISIIGPRRAGKTYSMFQLMKSLLRNINLNQILYVNFERTDLEGCESKDMLLLMETFYEIYPQNKKKKSWLFFDEVQNVSGWEKFVRTIIDSENVQVFISGSSSKLLSKEIATSLRGRTISYLTLPFSFGDYLAADGVKFSPKYPSSAEKAKIVNELKGYVEMGGYPEVVLYKEEKEKIIFDIMETVVYKDVIERYKIRNIKLMRLLIKSLINSVAREFSIHKFYNFIKSTGMKVSKNSLYNYVNALTDVFFVFPVKKFSNSYKETEQSLPKICIVDSGILTSNGINDYGRLIENLVFVELIRRGRNVFYFKSSDGKEVDFVLVEKGKAKELYQVAYSLDDFATKEREIKALMKASRELKCNRLTFITWDMEKEERINGKKIKYTPLWRWLTQKEWAP